MRLHGGGIIFTRRGFALSLDGISCIIHNRTQWEPFGREMALGNWLHPQKYHCDQMRYCWSGEEESLRLDLDEVGIPAKKRKEKSSTGPG